MVGAPTHSTAPENLVHAKARLATTLIEASAARRVERVDGQMRVLTFAGLGSNQKRPQQQQQQRKNGSVRLGNCSVYSSR